MNTVGSAVVAATRYAQAALEALRERLAGSSLDAEQHAAHGYAWIATAAASLEALAAWHEGVEAPSEVDDLVLTIGFGETLAQLAGGIAMGQNEIVRPIALGLEDCANELATNPEVRTLIVEGNAAPARARLVSLLRSGATVSASFGDPILDTIRDQYHRFTEERIVPHAHRWHLANALIPDDLVAAMAEMGTFGVCIPEEFGGLGLGKLVMCIVTEELSRGWIGTGSLGTRSEIAGELIMLGGTPEQKAHWLPRIASGETLPTAVFTEPDTGSDMASLTTRATRTADGGWRIDGAKTWITHAARADLMTLMARTTSDKGYAGLSLLLVPKQRGNAADAFPDAGLSGSEIEVLGYRGMREYALQFDGFAAPSDALLGGREGAGFKQLMQTFEGARIQTAARAVGVGRRAFELAFRYACDRTQFGRPILEFPRVADKLAMMQVDLIMARELTYAAARTKDMGRRCDIEAGMAKLLATRAAWTAADAALQIHGGNGYALEYEISRVLCDARILNIFEGAAEIQAQVIARGKLQGRN
ncbi:acyl-CoA dehydrogenase family protein [Novosphingobium sp. Gsoil 351]|uniref:acyl-CoA dehydrogenase family protein n=1 Tax=Novosphingobium sp. Gsoil 351 TaxID=2675225 RepID=UPI0012B442B7|nr:acyl-CoA dehydrogenase family protein [Novosphingobium sp. Gsoil 351]QGN55526.1 acyl-CoA dehydrogenase [Novosphingobium sp. Gsoil 351]